MAKHDKNGQLDASKLTTEQENAIDLLLTGKRDAEVGELVGVTRQTVNQWRNHNPAFMAELNRRRLALWEGNLDRLRSLVSDSVSVLESDLNGPDPAAQRAAAVHILRAVGIYGGKWKPDGETSERTLEVEQWLR